MNIFFAGSDAISTDAINRLDRAVEFATTSSDTLEKLRHPKANRFSSLAVVHTNFAAWSVLVLAYGSFIPNTAKRAAMVLIPIACLPLLVNLWLRTQSEAVAEALAYRESWLTAPLPFVAVFAAVFAAHTVSQLRRDVFTARQMGQYHLKQRIAVGGMGEVYEAEHVLLKRRCALKMIRTDRETAPDAINQYENVFQKSRTTSPRSSNDVFRRTRLEDSTTYVNSGQPSRLVNLRKTGTANLQRNGGVARDGCESATSDDSIQHVFRQQDS